MSELEQAKADNVKLVEERERLVREVADASQHIQMLERRAADNSELASSMLASTWMSAGANALPQYDLEKREFPFSQFRVDFEIYCRGMGLSENSPTRKMLLHRALVGLALQRYKDTLQTGSITSYQAIMDDLEQYLTALEGGVKYSSTSFHKKQQGDSETVTAYYAGLMKLAKTSWPDPNNPAPEQVVLEQFIRGLRLPLKRIVLAKEPSTLKDALEHACKAQAQREFLLEDEPLVTAAAVANDSLAQQVNVLTKQVSNLVAFNAAQRPPLHNYRHTPPPPPSNGKNFWPEPRHHFPARRSGGGPKPGTAYNRKGDQRCWNCQGWGHFDATCRKPRKPVSDRQNQLGRAVPRPARGVVNTVSVDDSQVTQHTSAPSAGSGVSFGNGHIFLATICFMSMVSVCAAQRPMLCQTSVKGQLFRLPEIYDCQPDVSSAPTTPARVTIELARRNLLQYETKGWLCRGVKSSARLLRYFFGDETLKEFSESAIPVSIDQCREMVKGGVSPAGPLATSPTGMMETKNMLNWRVPRGGLPECCKWWEWKEDNYFVTPVSVYTHFGAKRFQCTGADVSECPGYAQGSCRLGDKALVWEVNHKVECEFLPYQNLSGNMAHKSWMSDNGQLALTTHFDRNVSDCEITWILSDQGIAFRHIDQARAKRESASNGDVGYVMTDMLASELQALHDTVVKEMHTVYRHSLQQACSSLKLTSELVRAFTIASPTVAVRQLLNRTDVVADSSHGILELWSCLEVRNVTFKTISSKEVSKGSCIRELPLVLHMNGAQYDGYLDTNTLIVKHTGTIIDCSERPWVTFRLLKRMYTYH